MCILQHDVENLKCENSRSIDILNFGLIKDRSITIEEQCIITLNTVNMCKENLFKKV